MEISLRQEPKLKQEQKLKLIITQQMLQKIDILEKTLPELEREAREKYGELIDFEDEPEFLAEGQPDDFENLASSEQISLYEHLENQIHARFEGKERQIALAILNSLDDKGYLDTTKLAEEISRTGASEEEVEKVRREFMKLDPQGCGAKNRIEYIKFLIEQAKGKEVADEFEREFQKALELEKNGERNREIVEKIKELVKDVKVLPYPAFEFSSSVRFEPVKWDIEVFKEGEDIYIYFNRFYAGVKKLKSQFEKLLEPVRQNGKAKEFYAKLKEARNFAESINKRREYLQKVARAIFTRQKEFLDEGDPDKIKPLTLREISEETGLDESTISRTIKDKWVKTPFGIFKLKDFLQVKSIKPNSQISQREVKQIILELIQNEDKSSPLSDGQIQRELEKRGIKITRRAVTKYRNQLGIPPAEKRKKEGEGKEGGG